MPRIRLSATQTVTFTQEVEVTDAQIKLLENYVGCEVDVLRKDEEETAAYDLLERLLDRKARQLWSTAFTDIEIEKP